MSNKKNQTKPAQPQPAPVNNSVSNAAQTARPIIPYRRFFVFTKGLMYLKSNITAAVVICFVTLGAIGATLKYLEEDAQREMSRRAAKKNPLIEREEPLLNTINPFLPPMTDPTPQLAKEYIYAGSRMLAVEDKNAAALPPADLAVWRPSTGVWWIMGGTGSQQFSQGWGQDEDVTAPGDYDGDGKTDLCIFRPQSNTWWILKSSDGSYYSEAFGMNGDKAAQADYDGDGKTDIAVFRPSNGTWYIKQSSNGAAAQGQFGIVSDQPTPKDFDGDGRADLAVWRAGNSTFYTRNSSDDQLQAFAFSQTSTAPVPADYDGDGRADFAIRETNSPNWIIRSSAAGQTQAFSWGQAADIEVPNDYDGDGKVDIAVWRGATGTWFIRRSAAGGALRQEVWGQPEDIPVPAFYRR